MLVVAVSSLGLAVPPVTARNDVPVPTDERLIQTTLSLLRYNREQCHSLAEGVQRYWRELPLGAAGDGSAEERVRAHVNEDLPGDLAAARAAGDIAHSFLPRTLEAVNRETGAALTRLYEAQRRLCDAVAYPSGDRAQFGGLVTDLKLGIDDQMRELGRLLVVPDSELDAALEPYLTPIQLAGVEAQGELVTYLESLQPPPEAPDPMAPVRAWGRRYHSAVSPTKTALGTFLRSRGRGDWAGVREACLDLSRATATLMGEKPSVFRGPVPNAERPLQSAFRSLSLLAAACNAGDFRRVDEHLASAQRFLAAAARPLAGVGLQP